MTKSKKMSKACQKFDFGMEPKITTLLPTCFWIIAIHLVCRCSLPVWRRSFLKKGTPLTYFGPAPGRIWPKNNNTCKGPWVLHPYQVSSKSIQWFWRRSRNCENFTDDRQTDGWTDKGRCAMTIAHSSLQLWWAKKRMTKAVAYKFDILFKNLDYNLWTVCICPVTISDVESIFQSITVNGLIRAPPSKMREPYSNHFVHLSVRLSVCPHFVVTR